MKDNTCNYSDEWQPYIGDYDKYEYDLRLKDGTIVENCYPNAGSFSSISDKHDQQEFNGEDVAEIRFSEKPRYGLNSGVSERPQYEWLDAQSKKMDDRRFATIGVRGFGGVFAKEAMEISRVISDFGGYDYMLPQAPKSIRNKVAIPVRNSNTDPKIGRNEPCPCKSGKKYKHCCISKTNPS